jgi:23S rRNA maturation-related 3'-5' exoribonuclease YhaM
LLNCLTFKVFFAGVLQLLVIFSTGCCKTHPEFIVVCNDHRQITHETTVELIKAIEQEVEQMKQAGIYSEEYASKTADLIARLQVMDQQADVIARYALATSNKEQIAETIRLMIKGE